MAQRLIPGAGYVDDNFTGTRLVPGVGYVQGSAVATGTGLTASFAYAEADDAGAIAATVTNKAAFAYAEQDDASAITAASRNNASFAYTEADDATAITGTVSEPAAGPVNAAFVYAEQDDITDLSAALSVLAQFSYTEQDDAGSIEARLPSNGAPGYDTQKRRKYIVRKNGQLLVFSDPEQAKAALDDDEPEPNKQYPAKKADAKSAPSHKEAAQTTIAPKPVETIDLSEIRAVMARNAQQAEYQRLLAQQQYETLLGLLERIREDEEEDDWLLMQS